MKWKRLPETGPRQRCTYGGWRCKDTATWWCEGARRHTVLCDSHYRAKTREGTL